MAETCLAEAIEHHQAGRLEQAETGYRDVLSSDPDNADAIHLLGVIAFQRGDLEDARASVTQAISLDPSVALYHANLGRIAKARGQLSEAISAYRQAISLEPDASDVLSDLAGALVEVGQYQESLITSQQALDLHPNFPQAMINQAEACFQLGRAAQEEGRTDDAETQYRKAISSNPDHVEAHTNLGNILRADGRLNEALECYAQALTIFPGQSQTHSNKGVALQETGRREDAITSYREAIRLDDNNAEARRNLSMALLKGGAFEEGWSEFEWRWKTPHFAAIRRQWKKPQWAGERLSGRTVLVHAEQGFGDCFQMARYIPELKKRGGRVIVEAPDVLAEVLQTVGGIDEMITPGNPSLPNHDFHIPMMSLPGAFDTTFDNVPTPEGYLFAPRDAIERWQSKIPDTGKRKTGSRVGIVWKGNPIHPRDSARSPGLEAFRPLLDTSTTFYSLQKDGGGEDIRAAGLTGQLVDLEPELQTFSDTAAAIDQLDLIITPDTAVAHLAGAMGKPVWILLEHIGEWRWFEEREACPWYVSARVFRQESSGDWGNVVGRITAALENVSNH